MVKHSIFTVTWEPWLYSFMCILALCVYVCICTFLLYYLIGSTHFLFLNMLWAFLPPGLLLHLHPTSFPYFTVANAPALCMLRNFQDLNRYIYHNPSQQVLLFLNQSHLFLLRNCMLPVWAIYLTTVLPCTISFSFSIGLDFLIKCHKWNKNQTLGLWSSTDLGLDPCSSA